MPADHPKHCQLLIVLLPTLLVSCRTGYTVRLPVPADTALTGTEYYKKVAAMKWNEREPIALDQMLAGSIPAFLKKFVAVHVTMTDSTGHINCADYFVTPDYLSIGTNKDFARVPLSSMAAQQIADSLHCFLPTRKMVDDIYKAATVKLAPVPLYAFRDSSVIFWHHHLIIEGQRHGRKGLIAGIKKDLVISGKLLHDSKPDREAIYGWHQLNGVAIQPLYTGHVNWYVDYSHGVRLVYELIKVNGRLMNYKEVLQHPMYRALLCDEQFCDCYRY